MITNINHCEKTSLNSDCVLGVVLAGGLSSRMGQDKSLLPRGNAPNSPAMVDFSKQLLTESGISNIVISGDNHQVHDLVKGAGPVGGIFSVLQYCLQQQRQPKALLILPVDLPLMTAAALKQLRLKGELSQKATFYTEASGKAHNIPLYLPNNAFLALFLAQAFKGYTQKQGEKNGPSIRALLKQVPHQAINLAQPANASQILFNSNTPQEWQKAQQKF
jgi:molybdopterin-guanine dinucleotide biosynthesis protein A